MAKHMQINKCNAIHQQDDGKERHLIISLDTADMFDKTQNAFVIKTLNVFVKGNVLQHNEVHR
jgi:hypothetical protein